MERMPTTAEYFLLCTCGHTRASHEDPDGRRCHARIDSATSESRYTTCPCRAFVEESDRERDTDRHTAECNDADDESTRAVCICPNGPGR